MARRIVESAPTGETFVFDDDWNTADGRVRRLEYELKPGSGAPPHFHPGAAQTFDVVSGALHIRVNGKVQVLRAGDRATTGPGDVHAQWNEGPEIVRAVEGYDPPVDIEPFFTVLPHAIGSRNPLKMAVVFADFRAVSGPGNLPLTLMTTVLAPLGRLFGYDGWYKALTS